MITDVSQTIEINIRNKIDEKKIVFTLPEEFINEFRGKQPNWGPLGYFTYKRTYARLIPSENRSEEFFETIRRVVEGVFTTQKKHCITNGYVWNEEKAEKSSKEMYRRIWMMKFLPPGRGLWIMGTELIEKKGGAAANNCAFVSTKNIVNEGSKPFRWAMDMLMLGVGIGFDVKGSKLFIVKKPKECKNQVYKIPDSREGWVIALGLMIDPFIFDYDKLIEVYKTRSKSNMYKDVPIFDGIPSFDFSQIRKKGELIKGFGGKASGSKPLINLLNYVYKILMENVGKPIRSIDILDIFNNIGKCVVAGNVRRSAEISLGFPKDSYFLDAKTPKELEIQPEWRQARWASNNTIIAKIGYDYTEIAKRIAINGEPGIFFIDNAKKYSRMCDPPDNKDYRVEGVNPCFTGDTLIAVADGRNAVPIKQLAEEGKDVLVYSINPDGKVEIKMGRHPRLTRKNVEIVKIILDDDSAIKVTPDHEMRLIDGSVVLAKDLKVGDSLPRFRKEMDEDHYRVNCDTLNPKGSRYNEHILVSQFFNSKKRIESIKQSIPNPMIGKKISNSRRKYIESLTDLPIFWKNDTAYVIKKCEYCGNELIVKFTNRERAYCSKRCLNYADLNIKRRKEGQHKYFNEKQKSIRHNQIFIYKELRKKLGRNPLKKEWEMSCRESVVPYRINLKSTNPYVIKSYRELIEIADVYNHRVKKIEFLSTKKDVYNITVDDNHTVAIIMKIMKNGYSGIFTFQCGEQSLESYEMCCLVETFPNRHENFEDFRKTLKMAYMYAKTITLLNTHWPETNNVMDRNRRIGTSISGLMNAHNRLGRSTMMNWIKKGYAYLEELDRRYSEDWLIVNKSIKKTTIKPSGTTSLLPGESPGIHYPHSEYYIRRIRVDTDSPLIPILKDSHYHVYQDPKSVVYKFDKNGNIIIKNGEKVIDYYTSQIVEFPVHEKDFLYGKKDVSMWKQLANVIDYQKYWSDNQVSVTITFTKEEARELGDLIAFAEDKVKSISFLPLNDHGYENAPYETITKEKYEEIIKDLKPLDFSKVIIDGVGEKYCMTDGGRCNIN